MKISLRDEHSAEILHKMILQRRNITLDLFRVIFAEIDKLLRLITR